LAKVADPEALAASSGPRARLKITVPRRWLREGAEIEVTAPKLLSCDRCDGCDRSGALRAPAKRWARLVSVELPTDMEEAIQIRLVEPFDDCDIEQLMLRVVPGDDSSKGVRRIARPAPAPTPSSPSVTETAPSAASQALQPLVVVIVVAILVALAMLL